MLNEVFGILNRKILKTENYSIPAANSVIVANIIPPGDKVLLVTTVSCSMQGAGIVKLILRPIGSSSLDPIQEMEFYAGEGAVTWNELYVVVRPGQQLIVVAEDTSGTTNEIYTNYEYIELTEAELINMKDKFKELYNISDYLE